MTRRFKMSESTTTLSRFHKNLLRVHISDIKHLSTERVWDSKTKWKAQIFVRVSCEKKRLMQQRWDDEILNVSNAILILNISSWILYHKRNMLNLNNSQRIRFAWHSIFSYSYTENCHSVRDDVMKVWLKRIKNDWEEKPIQRSTIWNNSVTTNYLSTLCISSFLIHWNDFPCQLTSNFSSLWYSFVPLNRSLNWKNIDYEVDMLSSSQT